MSGKSAGVDTGVTRARRRNGSRSPRQRALGIAPGDESGDWTYLEILRERLRVWRCRGHRGCLDDDRADDQLEAAADITGLPPNRLKGSMVGVRR